MVTTVVADTVAVAIVKLAVKLFAGAVVDAGTLATAGLLLVSEITAPPSGAPELSTTVPLEGSPPDNRRRIDVDRAQDRAAAEPAVA